MANSEPKPSPRSPRAFSPARAPPVRRCSRRASARGGGNLEDLGWNDMGFEPPKPAELAARRDSRCVRRRVVEHPRAHPTGLTPGRVAGARASRPRSTIASALDEAEDEVDDTAEPSRTRPSRSRAPTPRRCPARRSPSAPARAARAPRRARPLEPRARPHSRCGSTRAAISSCGSPARSTAARRSRSSPMRSTSCSPICRNSTPWPKGQTQGIIQ